MAPTRKLIELLITMCFTVADNNVLKLRILFFYEQISSFDSENISQKFYPKNNKTLAWTHRQVTTITTLFICGMIHTMLCNLDSFVINIYILSGFCEVIF